MLFSEDDTGAINERRLLLNKDLLSKCDTEKSDVIADKKTLQADVPSCVLKHKSVFKCKICPRITCLSEGTLRDHLQSKVMCFFFWGLIMVKQKPLLFIHSTFFISTIHSTMKPSSRLTLIVFCSALIYQKTNFIDVVMSKIVPSVGGGLAFSLCLLRVIVHSKLNHLVGYFPP